MHLKNPVILSSIETKAVTERVQNNEKSLLTVRHLQPQNHISASRASRYSGVSDLK